jgi:hypothetical protein
MSRVGVKLPTTLSLLAATGSAEAQAVAAVPLVGLLVQARGFYPSCGGLRLTARAAQLVEAVLPRAPVRQWVLTPMAGLLLVRARERVRSLWGPVRHLRQAWVNRFIPSSLSGSA